MHCRGRRWRHALVPQHHRDFARAPGRVGIAHREDPRFEVGRQPSGAVSRAARAIFKVALARRQPPQPQMTCLPADPKPLAQRRYVRPRQRSQHHELPTLIRHRYLPPAHPNLPAAKAELSGMSPNAVRYLSGPYNKPGDDVVVLPLRTLFRRVLSSRAHLPRSAPPARSGSRRRCSSGRRAARNASICRRRSGVSLEKRQERVGELFGRAIPLDELRDRRSRRAPGW